ncbi:kinesin-like protein KIF18A isoform X1 [Drosophila albomicans]|uniref:Kinesin-like protein KIF18A isoform X1 n=1 Tax=Drosophila albomicans TaxID=7291 RepID=A0A6P8X0Q8_DROAB|nr:kinesin-like protein KIF18A isoform X1 [Drosophila albomicans]
MPEPTNIKVVVRVRPYNRREQEQNQRCIIKVMDSSSLLFDPDEEDDEFFFQGAKQQYRDISKRTNKKLSMEYDRVYDTERTNEDIFAECTAPLVDAVLDGYNCSVFVYGATGAGKTFTMLGSENCPGITFLTMRDLFEKIQMQQDTRKFDVGVSYLEVYNEQVMNLLTKTGPLKLREDSNGVVVSGLVLTPIYSAEELLRMLTLGNSNRTQHPTDANAESSRSHAIFQVHIRITDRTTGTKRSVKLSMIDLAGSERAASTKGMGMRFKEGASINKSLLALGNCINKLADGLKHIPYRDSNLTRILKDSLGGNCRTLMVANVSMSSITYEDTYNTLKYASRAKKIRTVLRQNVLKSNLPKEFYVKKVNEVMVEQERLMERNKLLEAKLAQLERASNEHSFDPAQLTPWYSKIDAVYSTVTKLQQCVIGLRSKIQSLSYRQKLKKDFEQLRKVLTMDQRVLQEDYKLFTNYLSALSSRTQKYTDQLPEWRSKLEAACMDLKRLKQEVKESKHYHILNQYLSNKDLEVQLSKQQMNCGHLTAINNELVENSDLLLKSFTNGSDVLHQLYDRLEETQKLTPDIQTAYARLERRMRFTEAETAASLQDTELDELLAEQLQENQEPPEPLTSSARKRARARRTHTVSDSDFVLHLGVDSCEDTDSDEDNNDETAHVFKRPCNLNVTQVLTHNANQQHKALTATVTKPRPVVNRRIVSDMISDQSVCGSTEKEKIKQALFKSSKFSTQELKRTCAAAIQKENLKTFSNGCVRKSPRALIAKTLAGGTAMMRKPISRLVGTINTGGKDAPVVKINRAASFRIKK